MPRFSANLTLLFTEVDFMDRFERAARAGFKAVEYMFPYPYAKEAIAEKLRENGLKQVLFNLPAGDWAGGSRGIALVPEKIDEFKEGVEQAVQYARALGCSRINCLVGKTPNLSPALVRETLIDNLRFAAERLAKEKIRLLIEILNPRDFPGFHLTTTPQALALMREVAHPNLFYQCDVYHMQVMEGDLMETIRKLLPLIAHIQIADNPGRHEPGTGEINFPNLLSFLDRIGYQGYVGCEYKPLEGTEKGLAWIRPYLTKENSSC
jgi:hydroxypyruvate isomerase